MCLNRKVVGRSVNFHLSFEITNSDLDHTPKCSFETGLEPMKSIERSLIKDKALIFNVYITT